MNYPVCFAGLGFLTLDNLISIESMLSLLDK